MTGGAFGVEGVRHYQHYRDFRHLAYGEGGWIDLDYTFNITNGVYDALTAAGYSCPFYWGDTDVWAVDLEPTSIGGLDESMADNVDLFFWAGHSFDDQLNWAEVVYDSSNKSWSSPSTRWQLGDRDLEWLVLYTCDSIKMDSFFDKYRNIFNGLHLILGSYGTMYFGSSTAHVGRDFAENLIDGQTLPWAWFNAAGVDNSPAVLSAERAETWNNGNPDWTNTTMFNDHYHGRGRVMPDVSSDRFAWMGLYWLH